MLGGEEETERCRDEERVIKGILHLVALRYRDWETRIMGGFAFLELEEDGWICVDVGVCSLLISELEGCMLM